MYNTVIETRPYNFSFDQVVSISVYYLLSEVKDSVKSIRDLELSLQSSGKKIKSILINMTC